jgi:hypothetical protein
VKRGEKRKRKIMGRSTTAGIIGELDVTNSQFVLPVQVQGRGVESSHLQSVYFISLLIYHSKGSA